MHLVDHGTVQRHAGFPVALPVESGIDDDRLRYSPRVITKIASQIFLLISDDITEHFIRPAHFSRDSFRIRIEEKFRTVKPQPLLRIVRAANAKAVQLPWPRVRQKHMPDLVGVFSNRNANVLLGSVNIVEQAQFNRGRGFRKKSKVDAVTHPCRAKGIWIAEPCFYRSHKRAPRIYPVCSARWQSRTAGRLRTAIGSVGRALKITQRALRFFDVGRS